MEVHAHTHTPRKKWTHYFWEFLMLFLAVFCGFLAENFREHQVEHKREKKFMASLIYDLRQDTAGLNRSADQVSYSRTLQDSVLLFLNSYTPGDFLNLRFNYLIAWSLNRFSIVFNDVTAMQLKNAGNLRLIRNQETIRKISEYWTEQESTKIYLERYLEYRRRNREYSEKLFDFAEIELAQDSLIKMPEKGMKVICKDPALWAEFKNNFAHCRLTTGAVLHQLKKQKEFADELIAVLNREYHLE
jgi:hypothetical protein